MKERGGGIRKGVEGEGRKARKGGVEDRRGRGEGYKWGYEEWVG